MEQEAGVEEIVQDDSQVTDDQQIQGQVVEEHMIPKERFDQVNNLYRTYKEFGKPEEVKAQLEKLRKYEEAVAQHRQKQTAAEPDDRAKIRTQLLEVMPELANVSHIERIQKANVKTASRHLESTLKSQNIDATPELRDEVEDYLWSKMTEDERESLLFGDMTIVDSVFERSIKSGLLASLKKPAIQTPPPVPKRQGPTGTPPAASKKSPSWKDADDAGWELMKEKG